MQTATPPIADTAGPLFLSAGRIVAVLAGVMATVLQVLQVWVGLGFGPGEDFVPLRHAAQGLLAGSSVYADPTFVYPPSAALPLLITAIGSETLAAQLWAMLSIAGLCTAGWLIGVQARPGWRVITGGVSTFGLVVGCAANDSLDLGNLSLLLVPLAVAMLVAMGRDRWLLGCALLCASLLIKPLLLPVLVVPFFFGHGRDLIKAVTPAAVVLLLSMLLVPGGRRFPHVFTYDLSGTNLHGLNAQNNLSIAGWLEAHGVKHDAAAVWRLIGVAIVIAVICTAGMRLRGSRVDLATVAQGVNLVLVGALLVGRISEIHFLIVVLACGLLQLTAHPTRWAAACLVPGLAMLAVPDPYRDMLISRNSSQSWYLIAELALLIGTALTAFGAPVEHSAIHPPVQPAVAVTTVPV